ncbi:MAG: hypothetical protein JWM68_1149 [Verrucomicrobiales bacterium]|nr:hypothetical protein [Verrucomicrobiales bacterium]
MCKVLSRLNLMLAASIALFSNLASAQISVPTSPVTAYIEGADESFFTVQLSGVPAGLDVKNAVYASYCVSYFDAGSPVGTHPVQLYSSTGTVPADFAESWPYINYILNHKQGSGDDVQAAIWYFTDGITTDISTAAQAMIDEALASGGSYLPGPGALTAVIVQALDGSDLQTIIIEVPTPTPPACDDFLTGGGWVITSSGAKANFGVQGGIRKGAYWGGLNYVDHGTRLHVKATAVTAYITLTENTREIHYDVKINGVAGTAVVTVTDQAEPGTHDTFQIVLSTGYSAGGELGGTQKKGGGGNIQLHKSKCK